VGFKGKRVDLDPFKIGRSLAGDEGHESDNSNNTCKIERKTGLHIWADE
jgi:hypothetical protein